MNQDYPAKQRWRDWHQARAQEKELFMEQVNTCFSWENMTLTTAERTEVRREWFPGQAPIDVVRRLLRKRDERNR